MNELTSKSVSISNKRNNMHILIKYVLRHSKIKFFDSQAPRKGYRENKEQQQKKTWPLQKGVRSVVWKF